MGGNTGGIRGGLGILILGLLAALAGPAEARGRMDEGFLDSEEFYVRIKKISQTKLT